MKNLPLSFIGWTSKQKIFISRQYSIILKYKEKNPCTSKLFVNTDQSLKYLIYLEQNHNKNYI